MFELKIKNLQGKAVIPQGKEKSLLVVLQEEGLDWMHKCGGKGRCTTCRVEVCSGEEFLGDKTEFEQNCEQKGSLKPTERLTCQAYFSEPGKVEVEIPITCQLAHVTYSE